MTPGEALRDIRRAAGLTQAQLAAAVGWRAEDQSKVSAIELDKYDMRAGEMQALETACRAAPGTIFRLIGYLTDVTVEAAVNGDPALEPAERAFLLRAYRGVIDGRQA